MAFFGHAVFVYTKNSAVCGLRLPFIFTRENEPKPTALQKLPLRSDFCEPRRLPHPKPTFYVTQTTVPKRTLSSDWRR